MRCEASLTTEGDPRKELTDGDWRSELLRGGLCNALRSLPPRWLDAVGSPGVKRPELEAEDDEIESDGDCACLDVLGDVG